MAIDYSEIRRQLVKYKNVQSLMRYINVDTLKTKHQEMKDKATGIDKVTKKEYEKNLEENLENIVTKMKTFSYRPKAVRRVYIPKQMGN